ncbi:MAG: acetate--CoA ligase [Planctomycetota bacterium]
MLFALMGKYDPLRITEIHEKEKEVFDSPPLGLRVLGRYSTVGRRGGFIDIVEAESAEQLAALTLKFVGMVEYEIVPLIETVSGKAFKLVSQYHGEIVPMHGPIDIGPELIEATEAPAIISVMQEVRKFMPPKELAKKAHIKTMEEYKKLYKQSIDDPDTFWAERAGELHWFKKWTKVRDSDFADASIKWFINGKTNMSYNCLDRHMETDTKKKVAIIWEGESGEVRKFTYEDLYNKVNKLASGMKKLGVKKGDRVTIYLPMIPELPVALLACARIGAIHSVVFGGFSAEALIDRITDCKSTMLITCDGAYRSGKSIPTKENADKAAAKCPTVEKMIVVKHTGTQIIMDSKRDTWWYDIMNDQSVPDFCKPEEMDAEDPLFILYTSGSTGKPKGVLHTTGGYMVYTYLTFKWIFDYHNDDIFFCTADIGWVTGHSYIVYGPLATGATEVMFEGVPTYPHPNRFWEIVEKHKVTTFYTAPTAIRALASQGDEWTKKNDLSSLRILGSVGEPINPEAWMWYYKNIGKEKCPILDTWWQTETGGILITPLPGAIPVKPGSASMPFFGVQPEVVNAEGKAVKKGEGGYLIIKQDWPGMMRGVYGDEKRFFDTYFTRFPGVYFTGDGCRIDEEGFYWLMGRVDDVINVSGHRIGTAEVESALVSHAKVAEAAVVGFPHDIKGQGIYAYVTLNSGIVGNDEVKKELISHVTKIIGPIAKPDVIQFAPSLPKTRSGKIMRRILRKVAEGITTDLGDISTLADPSVVEQIISGSKRALQK